MAVDRVSPDGPDAKGGYLWTMSDPPGSDPVVVHHDAVVVHHDAVTETRWFVSASVEYSRSAGGETASGLSDDLGWTSTGTARPTESTSVTLSGQRVAAGREGSSWRLMFFSDSSAWYPVGGSMETGSYAFAVGDGVRYAGTLSVTVEGREVETSPAWDEEVEPAWDEEVSPASMRKVSYLGDYAGGSGPGVPLRFSAPPPDSGLSPSSLRGEAVAYLVSGYARVAAADDVGAAWAGPGGRVETVPGLFSRAFPASPRLDLFRLRLLDYLFARRAPAAPQVSSAAAPAAFMSGGSDDYASSDPSVPSRSGVPVPASGAPEWGRSFDVAADQAALDAAGGAWLSDSGRGSAPDFAGFAGQGYGLPSAEASALALFAASASPAQPSPVLGRDCGFSSGYVPGADVPQASPEPVPAGAVSDLFARPSGDPAAMTRCWSVGSAPALFGFDPASLDGGAAPDPDCGGPRSFDVWFVAGRERDLPDWRASAEAEWDGFWEAGGKWSGGNYGLRRSDSPSGMAVDPGYDAAVLAWAAAEGRAPSGPVGFARAWRAAYAGQATGKAAPDGRPDGNCWLVESMTDASGLGSGAWVPYDAVSFRGGDGSATALRPMNYRPAQADPYYEPAPGASQAGRFGIVYAGSVSGAGVPRSAGPLAPMGAGAVPAACADDVAARPVFLATVSVREELACSDGTSPSVSCREWAAAGFAPSSGRWTRAAGEGAGAFAGPGDGFVLPPAAEGLARFAAETVLGTCGIDPAGLLRGASSGRFVPLGWNVEVYRADTGDAVESWPAVAYVESGDAVVRADVRVSVGLRACVFESGYCA